MSRYPAWMRAIRVGDVLVRRGPRAVPRIVRDFKYLPPPKDMGWVDFVIRRCSWTKRPLTTMSFNDLRTLGYEPIGVRVALHRRLDKKIARCAQDPYDRSLTCCDVEGVY